MTGASQGLWSFPRRRGWCAIAFAVFGCALLSPACGGGQPAARGFGSTEIEPIRDSTLVLEGENGPGVVIYGTGGPGGGVPASANYWTLNLSTGAVQSYGSQFPPSPSSSSSPPPSPYACALEIGDGSAATYTLQIVDDSTGTQTEIANVVSYAQCPGPDAALVAFVVDASGNTVLSTGPFTQLAPVPLPLQVSGVDWWSFDPVTNAPTAVTVQAALPAAPGEIGVYTIELGSQAITPDVPAVPTSVAWATGAIQAGSLQSTAVAVSTEPVLQVGDHYVYPRVMSDAGTTLFAGPFLSGAASELALFQIPPGTLPPTPYGVFSTPSATGYFQSFSNVIVWQLGGAAGATSDLMAWDDASQQMIACPSAPQANLAGVRSSDGNRVLFVTPQGCCQYLGSGPLSLATLANGMGAADSCTLLVASNVVTAAFSPDGSAMFWLIQPPTGEMQLWVAAGDGSGARMIGAGLMQNVHFVVPGAAQLELILDGDLVWLDPHDSTVQLHYVAEQVFEEIYDIGVGGWLITGYDYSTQDATATVGLVNRNTGDKRLISPDVVQFLVLSDKTGADGGLAPDASSAGALTVVYTVRGRNPSPQDGIWSATISTADLQ
ncbi:MAG TPA: hypothetical protein VLC06_23015 [Polyangia bacterium]|nr:hypothetical protein [Polyangia bacterium]